MMSDSRYFSKKNGFAEYLSRAGVEVFLLDWRGHGKSVPPFPKDGDWTFESYVLQDLPTAMRAAAKIAQIEITELCYLGHSLGGLVGLAAFGTEVLPSPRKLSLWATSLWLPGEKGPWKRRMMMAGYEATTRLLGFAPIRLFRMGSNDEPASYVRQLTSWAKDGDWKRPDGQSYLLSLSNIKSDTWAVTGLGDELSSPNDAATMQRRIPGARPIRRVGCALGDAIDADHFTLFTARELHPLWDEFIHFLVEDE